jgi:hypothetical protein
MTDTNSQGTNNNEASAAARAAEQEVNSSDDDDDESNNKNDLKRQAVTDEESCGEEDSDSAKRPRTEDEALDLAVTLGYKTGDRIEIQWELEKQGETDVHWWGATLLEHDGRTTDSVAIRTILYDEYVT